MQPPFSETLFSKVPVVGILRGYSKDVSLKLIEIYYEIGFTNVEVTMNTPNVEEIIAEAVKRFANKLNVGAGTVCSMEDLDKALSAGAQFIVSPITDVTMIEACKKNNVPAFPGALTPTEIYNAWTAGARMVKLFPASQFGPRYIKEVLAPLDAIEIMPTGGVSLENIPIYKEVGVKAFGMGSLLFNKTLIQKEDWIGLASHLSNVKQEIEKL